jgi:hypothetical protein
MEEASRDFGMDGKILKWILEKEFMTVWDQLVLLGIIFIGRNSGI